MSACLIAFADNGELRNISEFVRIIDGLGEMIYNGVFRLALINNFPECKPLCDIPGLDKGYVPQGFCYIDSKDIFAVSAYSDDEETASVVSLVNAKDGQRIKTVSLLYEDGSKCQSHAGGLADIGDYLYVSSGKSVRRLSIADILEAEDYSSVRFCGKIETDMQASYLCSYENCLLVGQYYSFTFDNKYETPTEQRIYMPDGSRGYAMCEVLDLTSITADQEYVTPVAMLSMPNSVQGIAYDGKTLYMSSTSTGLGKSLLAAYRLENFTAENHFTVRGKEIPLIFMTKSKITDKTDLPPMMEGIDRYKGKIAGIFESGSEKFNVLIRTKNICVFK